MKYFLFYDPQSVSRDEAWEIARRQAKNYEIYLEGVREQIPPSLWDVVDNLNFGDYLIEEMDVDLSASFVRIKIIGERIKNSTEYMCTLKFSHVSQLSVSNNWRSSKSSFLTGVLEVTNHEIEVLESGLFEFRFAFVGRAEMAIRFKEFEFEQHSFE